MLAGSAASITDRASTSNVRATAPVLPSGQARPPAGDVYLASLGCGPALPGCGPAPTAGSAGDKLEPLDFVAIEGDEDALQYPVWIQRARVADLRPADRVHRAGLVDVPVQREHRLHLLDRGPHGAA